MENKKIMSACLLGIRCRYDGKSKPCEKAIELYKKGNIIPVCPEQLGGLPTPRIPSEVLEGKNKVISKEGKDVTENFVNGAKEALKIAKLTKAKVFIGKSKSPSCGLNETYDGTFSGKLVKSDGIAVSLFKKNGIKVVTEEDLDT